MSKTPSLTAVVHAIMLAPPSGVDARSIAALLPKNYQTLMSELSGQHGHKLGADLVLPIMRLAGSDEPMHFLARQMGGVFVRLPDSGGASAVHKACLESVKEFGELIAEVAGRTGDGEISREDKDVILREGHQAVTAIMGMLQAISDHQGGRT